MRHECWWCGVVPNEADQHGRVRKAPHTWWRRDIDGVLVEICGPCWERRDLQVELGRRRDAMAGSLA